MQLTLPDQAIRTAGLSESELKLELAVLLYAKRRITMVSGSHIAGITFLDFQREVAKRGVTVNYDLEELERDLKTLETWDKREKDEVVIVVSDTSPIVNLAVRTLATAQNWHKLRFAKLAPVEDTDVRTQRIIFQ